MFCTCCFKYSPKASTGTSEKQSIREAKAHLLAKNRLIRPLFLAAARPIKVDYITFLLVLQSTSPNWARKNAYARANNSANRGDNRTEKRRDR
uniref:Uncharacterized protein n=1 Tax=Romanomermis culicivorax TaxID=13658 RepID=A0A915K1Q6_ROMCU